eukprot:7408392-Prorocentrum_lima.AAC.1
MKQVLEGVWRPERGHSECTTSQRGGHGGKWRLPHPHRVDPPEGSSPRLLDDNWHQCQARPAGQQENAI